MWETLKELKTMTSNEDDYDKAMFQCDDVLEKLKTIDGHTFRNVWKKHQSFINCVGLTPTISISIDTEIVHVGISAPSSVSTFSSIALIEKVVYVKGWNIKHLVH